VVKKTLAALYRAGIQTALELQQTPPAFLLHLWGCSENSIRWLDRRMKARLGSGFARREVFLDAEQDWRVRNDAMRHALAATLADVEQWRPGLLKAEKKYAADRLAER
jgi:hypothetical protein